MGREEGEQSEGAVATLAQPAAAGVRHRAGAQRARAKARETWRGRLIRGPGRAERERRG
jgi:hypothetical protein